VIVDNAVPPLLELGDRFLSIPFDKLKFEQGLRAAQGDLRIDSDHHAGVLARARFPDPKPHRVVGELHLFIGQRCKPIGV